MIERFRSSPGPFDAHPLVGRMTPRQWEQFHCVHCAHHLSFALPLAPGHSRPDAPLPGFTRDLASTAELLEDVEVGQKRVAPPPDADRSALKGHEAGVVSAPKEPFHRSVVSAKLRGLDAAPRVCGDLAVAGENPQPAVVGVSWRGRVSP